MTLLDDRPQGKNRRPTERDRAEPVYRAVMLELERRRAAAGLSMAALDDLAGTPDGYYGKALHPDTPSGRQATWRMVQDLLDAAFPQGFDIRIEPKAGALLTADDLRRKVRFAAADANPVARRKLMTELGRKGGAARAALSPEQRREIALRAAATRAANRRAAIDHDHAEAGHHLFE